MDIKGQFFSTVGTTLSIARTWYVELFQHATGRKCETRFSLHKYHNPTEDVKTNPRIALELYVSPRLARMP